MMSSTQRYLTTRLPVKMCHPAVTETPAFCFLTALARPSASRTVKTISRRPNNDVPSKPISASESDGIRINKCFKSFASRRQSDDFIATRRVTINDTIAYPGARVKSGDVVKLDGQEIDWQRLNLASDTSSFVYIKHWKASGIVCTTSPDEPDNILSQISHDSADRIFPIGRLDEASTGIILLTSDGRLPNVVLGAGKDCSKEYLVVPDTYVTDEHLNMMRKGVYITTVSSRESNRKSLSAPTLACSVERGDGLQLLITLEEGRNRQIRKMLGALGYGTRAIHRVAFMGIGLDGLDGPGDSRPLNEKEMAIVKERLKQIES